MLINGRQFTVKNLDQLYVLANSSSHKTTRRYMALARARLNVAQSGDQ